jgi:hypothetical protein
MPAKWKREGDGSHHTLIMQRDGVKTVKPDTQNRSQRGFTLPSQTFTHQTGFKYNFSNNIIIDTVVCHWEDE